MSPSVDLTTRVLSGEGPVKRIDLGAGFWNSVHTGDTGSSGPIGKSVDQARASRHPRIRARRRPFGGIDLHRVYQPERTVHDREGAFIRLAFDDRGALGAAQSDHTLLWRSRSTPSQAQVSWTAASTLDDTLSSGRARLRQTRRLSRSRSKWVSVSATITSSQATTTRLVLSALGPRQASRLARIPPQPMERSRRRRHQALGETTKVFNGGDEHECIHWSRVEAVAGRTARSGRGPVFGFPGSVLVQQARR